MYFTVALDRKFIMIIVWLLKCRQSKIKKNILNIDILNKNIKLENNVIHYA